MKRILFILKRREDFNEVEHSANGLSTGLFNSATFCKDMLTEAGIESKIVVVVDNNDIDREVTKYRPTDVIIEALWVVPTKFSVLCKLHPNVKWIVRLHSDIPFIAGEGMAMDWLGDYMNYKNVLIATNSPRALREVRFYIGHKFGWTREEVADRIVFLPNYYPQEYKTKTYEPSKNHIDICCFGAVRPLKNHLQQAIAALEFAILIGKKLRFHINSDRTEMKGQSAMNNLKGMFSHLAEQGHELIMHKWAPREEFLQTCAKMDIGLQVSFSETFNIVGADLISQGVPLVGSKEIPWLDKSCQANPTETHDIVRALNLANANPYYNTNKNQELLKIYTEQSKNIWTSYFKK